ncbi:Protein CBG17255 [Caenorhabditis briggsae]|uniref:Protein CBG17255 n=1 Tax=Caenorhabditis briggsae TaxID=6238 RepID=A8XQH1_CAEBR|nr:Protein CBG17255 [Caenorhabditis briggsae]CAP34896.1 Protein CBG17255 [Caenorhabditis briggsae]
MEENTNATDFEWPTFEWCFDMEMWLHTMATPQNVSTQMRTKYAHYKTFSYRYNGFFTLVLILLGLSGSCLLVKQIYSSRVFSRRLAVHLGMICFWDMLYLLCCLSTYCIPSLIYSVTPIYGPFSYILFFLQPFASFCVSCTIWQVFAITLERYLAVSSPLEQRTRKAKFGVGWICVGITIGAFILNLLPVPFENELVDCFEMGVDDQGAPTFKNHTMMKPYYDDRTRIYRFLVHFFPDLLFRAPTPIIVIGTLTVRTIQACSQRSVGNFQIGMRMNRNMPLRLSLLNFKFILCNTLYMFNTILLELLEYGNMENGDYDGYINSFYLTDASNMLLVVHSATNWLLFYKFPSCRKKDVVSMTLSTSVKYNSVKIRIAEHIGKQISPFASTLGADIIHKLCEDVQEVRNIVHGDSQKESEQYEQETLVGVQFGQFVKDVFRWFGDRSSRISKKFMYKQYSSAAKTGKLNFNPTDWKNIRIIVIDTLVAHLLAHAKENNGKAKHPYSREDIEECATRVFNHVLSEMKNVALCANVEERQKGRSERFVRSNSTTTAMPMFREPPRKSHSVSMRFQYSTSVDSVQICEQQSLINNV